MNLSSRRKKRGIIVYFNLSLNINDLEKLEADYILSDYNIKWYVSEISKCIYKNDGIYIYKLNK